MAYPDDGVVQTWLDAWKGLNIRLKKMFGCYCVYCDGQAVGWLSGSTFSLREVGLDYLPGRLKRPAPGAPSRRSPSLWTSAARNGCPGRCRTPPSRGKGHNSNRRHSLTRSGAGSCAVRCFISAIQVRCIM